MSFDVGEFIAQINKGNVAKTSNFEVIVTPPQSLKQSKESRSLVYRIDSVDLPGRNVTFADNMIYGLPSKIVYGSQSAEISLTVILSEDLKEKDFFEKWLDVIVGPYGTGEIAQNMFDVKYYNDYIGTFDIKVYDELGEEIENLKLHEAYPGIIGNISYNWQNGAEIARLPITVYYRFYSRKKKEEKKA